MKAFLRNYKISVPVFGVVIAGLAVLAFGYFGVHTLFIDKEVSEAVPTFDVPAVDAESAAVASAPTDSTEEASDTASNETGIDAESDSASADAPDTPADEPTESLPEPQTEAAPEIVTEFSGDFRSDAHPTAGEAIVLGNGTGQRFLRFENFETDNGPDLNVYLVNSSTGDVSDFVDLGDLKGNIGEQNYEIPADVDLTVYDQIQIWCVRFGVGFGNATLMAV